MPLRTLLNWSLYATFVKRWCNRLVPHSPNKFFMKGCKFWGKFRDGKCLPLACHSLDVALCFRAILELPACKKRLDVAAGRRLSPVDRDRLAVLAALHDIGKANSGFQRKPFDAAHLGVGHTYEALPLIYHQKLSPRFWEVIQGDLIIGQWFPDEETAESYLLALLSHHGRPIQFRGELPGRWAVARRCWEKGPDMDPMEGIGEVVDAARRAFPRAFEPDDSRLPSAPEFHHLFCGLLILADWLGSHELWFPVEECSVDARIRDDLARIPPLLRAIGLDRTPFHLDDAPFLERFSLPAPRPLQALMDRLDPLQDPNRLLIAESETGSGKTEAALHWFSRLFSAGLVDGLYFALPTRVAAREIYGRVVDAINRWFPDPANRPVTLLAVPGYPQVDGISPDRLLPAMEEANMWLESGEMTSEMISRERLWTVESPKRFLAATVAVGTIDQALFSCIQTAHAHLRWACLMRSLLVVDEVHASDIYMARILESLLHHHVGLGGYAMLLSATLGAEMSQRLIAASKGQGPVAISMEEAIVRPYPSVTIGDGEVYDLGEGPLAPGRGEGKEVHLKLLPAAFDLARVVDSLMEALQKGGKVLVVLNTVQRAIELFKEVERSGQVDSTWLFRAKGVAAPHHGRFAPRDRQLLDEEVGRSWGKGSDGGPLLLVGTQTLEQSLDIDADLLVTDLAPADVLLQRIGRLHRHQRRRPPPFKESICLVLVPPEPMLNYLDDEGKVATGLKRAGLGTVYDLRMAALTWKAMERQPTITIPHDNRWFIEHAVHSAALARLDSPRWRAYTMKVEGEELMKELLARRVTIDFSKRFWELDFVDRGERVASRLGTDSYRIPLDRVVTSPFGTLLHEMVIPGHMAPDSLRKTSKRTGELVMEVEEANRDRIILNLMGKQYRYSRFGLETMESAGKEE